MNFFNLNLRWFNHTSDRQQKYDSKKWHVWLSFKYNVKVRGGLIVRFVLSATGDIGLWTGVGLSSDIRVWCSLLAALSNIDDTNHKIFGKSWCIIILNECFTCVWM